MKQNRSRPHDSAVSSNPSQTYGQCITAGGTAFVAGDAFNITVTANTGPIVNCLFVGPADASGNVEIAFNI